MDNTIDGAREKLLLAKLLLNKYGALHEFHVAQLKAYLYAAMSISIAGCAMVDTYKREVTFYILTEKEYYMKDGEAKKRSALSPRRLWPLPGAYRQHVNSAKETLTAWCQELLWPDTTIELIVDQGMPEAEDNTRDFT